MIVELDDAGVDAALVVLPERDAAAKLSGVRRREFIAGRTALHAALGDDHVAILADDRGAPVLPAGVSGSISHKGARAVAIVAPASAGFVGIDLERAAAPKLDIGTRILTARETRVTGPELTRVFAIKEAIYKAIDPIVRRYVGFAEVEVALRVDNTCIVSVVDPDKLPVEIEAAWVEHDGFWLATARARHR